VAVELEDRAEQLARISLTLSVTASAAGETATVIRPPGGVYLIALPRRLATICSRRTGSAMTGTA